MVSSEGPVKATGFASIALSVVILSSVSLFSAHPRPELVGAVASMLVSMAMLFMAMRKFANEEIDLGSKVVKKANILGFLGIILLLGGMVSIAGPSAYPVAYGFALALVGVWIFGKRNFRYW